MLKQLILLTVSLGLANGLNAIVHCKEKGEELYLWSVQVNPDGPRSWLAGTLHVPIQKIKIPLQVTKAQTFAEEFYMEVNDAECPMPRSPTPWVWYSQVGLALRVLDFLEAHNVNISMETLATVHPTSLAALVQAHKQKPDPRGLLMSLDVFLMHGAAHLKKPIGALERSMDQCKAFEKMDLEVAVKELEDTMDKVERHEDVDELGAEIQKYNCLLLEQDKKSFSVPTKKEFEVLEWLENDMLLHRNVKMTYKIMDLMRGSETSKFFAVGVRHFLGDNSIVDLLQNRGFVVERIKVDDDLNGKITEDMIKRIKKGRFLDDDTLTAMNYSMLIIVAITFFNYKIFMGRRYEYVVRRNLE